MPKKKMMMMKFKTVTMEQWNEKLFEERDKKSERIKNEEAQRR